MAGQNDMMMAENVWKEYHSKLHRFIKSKISDDTAANDILQVVFLKIHTGLVSLKDETKLQSWIYQITRNAIVDHFRTQKPTVEIPEDFGRSDSDPNDKTVQELSQCLQPMIRRLPEHYREAILLSEIDGLKQKEVARILGISLSGAKSRVQRGRVLLKKMLVDCCRLEFDHHGKLCDYDRKNRGCDIC